ncbi:hypothetical protein DFH08DRAFT_911633 [Mycena albidolilacea]|uniref:Uncharacterized protein n=1 Tax=Mycena albidolilacea TaxID=1033008 RepID=A0AAD7EXL3_9AGAR|nr:hypothetical protein DFH08DRAFT_911633 [Mycena albidolilacea]
MSRQRKRKAPESTPGTFATQDSSSTTSDSEKRPAKRSNQYLPCPAEEDLIPLVEYYWHLGFNDPNIATHSLEHFDRSKFGLSAKTVQRLRTKLGLQGVRQRGTTFESITPFYMEIRERFPNMGARAMRLIYLRKLLNDFLTDVEPDAVRQRRVFKFKRKRFWSAGVMDILCIDQHDKWKQFGLWPHLGIDPYPGRILWLKIWWTNRNPVLVTSYYLEACRKAGGIPLITQSDPGGENYGIANCHTSTCQPLDPSLEGTLQHRWMKDKMNIKPEATWSQMRRQFTPGFENILDAGVAQGLLVFRWLAIPWLQAELDAWVHRYNSTPRRRDKNKILPQGIPDLIAAKPHLYGTQDYKVIIPPELFDEMQDQWAPLNDPVFELTSPVFTRKICEIYESLGRPEVTSSSFWDVYCTILEWIVQVDEDLTTGHDTAFLAPMELLPGQKELHQGDDVVAGYKYFGGLAKHPQSEEDNDDKEGVALNFADLTDQDSS